MKNLVQKKISKYKNSLIKRKEERMNKIKHHN